MTGCKTTYRKCRETCQLSSSSPEKKASRIQTPINQTPCLTESLISVSTVMGTTATSTAVVRTLVKSRSQPTFLKKPLPLLAQLWRRKRGKNWLLVALDRSTKQPDLCLLKLPPRTAPLFLPVIRSTPRPHKPFHFKKCKRNMMPAYETTEKIKYSLNKAKIHHQKRQHNPRLLPCPPLL